MSGPTIFLLQHTHWDREWYHPAVTFRKRLVDLIDQLLSDLPRAPFLLDGQAIVLRDYLAVRPERAAELAAALRNGSFEAGPWYVLPDELIPGGEALVRNLLAGRRTLRALRATPPPVLYSPDAFGHPAMLPALARGFGWNIAIVWRGYGGKRSPPGDAARWSAPNGDTVLLFHLAPAGYELGASLPADDAAARRRFAQLRATLERRSTLGLWLVPNGADHHALQRDAEAAAAALQRAAVPQLVVRGGLARLAELALQRAAEHTLPEVHGELRDSYGYTWTLQGTFGTRAHQKRANALLERLLVRDVEPWAALNRLLHGAASGRHHLQHAWEILLACHPHDSLCGCSADAVARAVDQRQADARALAEELRGAALQALHGHDPDAARATPRRWQHALILRNPVPRPRGGVAQVTWDVELRLAPVGPGSAGRGRAIPARGTLALPHQVLQRERLDARIEAARHYPVNHVVERRHTLVWVPALPAYGIVAQPLGSGSTASPLPERVGADDHGVHNAAGSLLLRRKVPAWRPAGGAAAQPLLGFEGVGDRGDTYTHSPEPGARRASPVSGRVTQRGPLRGTVEATWRLKLPRRPAIPLQARVSLDAGAAYVRIVVTGENTATDHRLRALLHTGVRPRRVLADAAFALLERAPLRVPARDQSAERVPPTAPLHRSVTLFDGARGCTVVSDGLAEYEVLADGTVAVTLVRAVGALSRDDVRERPGHAGWPVPTPLAQCPGPFEAGFALAWHGGDSVATRAGIVTLLDDVLLPLMGHTQRDLLTLPDPVTGIALEGDGLMFCACKESEDGGALLLRCLNVTDVPVLGAWVLPQPVAQAHAARLDETPLEPLRVDGHRVVFEVPAHGLHSVLIAGPR